MFASTSIVSTGRELSLLCFNLWDSSDPIHNLPAGLSPFSLKLYAYLQDSETGGFHWKTVRQNVRVEGTLEAPIYVVQLSGADGMAFIGYAKSQSGPITEAASNSISVETAAQSSSFQCEPFRWEGSDIPELKFCRHTDTEGKEWLVTVHDFVPASMWGVSLEEMVSWLIPAQQSMADLGMNPDKKLSISMESLSSGNWAEVTANVFENCKTIHINTDRNYTAPKLRHAIAHELFHNGQCRTDSGLLEQSLNKHHTTNFTLDKVTWALEGSATWFQNYVYPKDKAHRNVFPRVPIPRVLEVGLAAKQYKDVSIYDPYNRFAFFQLLESSCNLFDREFWKIFSYPRLGSGIPYDATVLAEFLESAECDFGNHLGATEKATLESALVFYQYATLNRRDYGLLDPDDVHVAGDFVVPYSFAWSSVLDTTDGWLNRATEAAYPLASRSIPPSGAFSFYVPNIEGQLPENIGAELTVKVQGGLAAVISMMSSDVSFEGAPGQELDGHPHVSLETTSIKSHRYGSPAGVPQLFVTIVNPSLDDGVDVEVSFNIVPEAITVSSVECSAPIAGKILTCTILGTNIPELTEFTASNCSPFAMVAVAGNSETQRQFTCTTSVAGEQVEIGYIVPGFIGPLPLVPPVDAMPGYVLNDGVLMLSNREGNWEIYSLDLNDSIQANLTNNSAEDRVPSLSPDRTRIAFVSDRDGNNEIYVMWSDGSNPSRLTDSAGDDVTPLWSPNGQKIAFVSERDRNYEIYVMDADGNNQVRLTSTSADEIFPAWSPDSKSLAFVSERDGNEEIYIMNADASGDAKNLTGNRSSDTMPFFSPDGAWISFVSDRDGSYDLWVMDSNGGNLRKITAAPNNDIGWYAWSPDGSQIAFDSRTDGDYEVYVINFDGSGLRQLTNNSVADQFADWFWDGSKIVFISNRNGTDQIYTMDPDGGNPVNISNDSSSVAPPMASPVYQTGGGCFIATAAYGSYFEPEVMVLRQFRDQHLLPYKAGRALVDFYYDVSPEIANTIAKQESLKMLVRISLTPVVYMIRYPAGIIGFLFLTLFAFIAYAKFWKARR